MYAELLSQSTRVRILARSRSLPFDSGHVLLVGRTLSLVGPLRGFGWCAFLVSLKFCLYTIAYLLLQVFRLSLKSSLSTVHSSLSHNKSNCLGVGVQFLGPESESVRDLNFVTPESESHKNKDSIYLHVRSK